MKDGYILKSHDSGQPQNGEMDLINNYTRRKLKSEEVYVFTVVLCDNDIDREYERFSDEALNELSKLFVGKTGIMDHETTSENQMARIFDCKVEEVEGKVNQVNMPYRRLVARAYMPRCSKNEDFILELDSGIKKEVSVGCSVDSIKCSICGEDVKSSLCDHIKGREYKTSVGTQVCHMVLDNPKDAYEWSFVAVPAQREAGVIKSFGKSFEGGEIGMNEVMKKLSLGETVNLSKSQTRELYKYISELEEKATVGNAYVDELKSEVLKLSAMVQPDIDLAVMKSITNKMSITELKSFKKSYKAKVSSVVPVSPQLVSEKSEPQDSVNLQFKI